MAAIYQCLVESTQLPNTQTDIYTAGSGVRVPIEKLTFTNVGGASVTVTVNIVPSGDSVASTNRIVYARAVQPTETYSASEIVGQVLNSGDTVSVLVSAGSSLNVRMSGRVLS